MADSQKLEEKIKELQQEKNALKRELDVYKQKEDFINQSVIKSKEAFDVANFNAQKVVMKGLDFVNTINRRIEKLLNDLENSSNLEESRDLLDKFISKNRKYFVYSDEEKEAVAQKIKDQAIARIRS